MTAVMRALQPIAEHEPMALRVGVVRSGRIVEERVIRDRKSVSVGTAENATIALTPSGGETPRFELFAPRKDGYVLRFRAGTEGRISLAAGVVTFDALRERLNARDGVYEVALTNEARGKIVLGDTTLLFQFVRPPPRQARPQLPLAVKGGFANQVDWPLTIIAAVSFLLHFGGVGVMYSDWMDVVVDDHRSVAGLVDLVSHISPPAVTETPAQTSSAEATSTAAPTPVAATPTMSRTAKTNGASQPAPGHVDAHEASLLAAQAERMQLDLLGAVNASSSVETTLRRTEIPPVDLSSQAASNSSVTRGTSDLHVRPGGPAVAARSEGGLSTLAHNVGETSNGNAGVGRTIAAPKVEPQIGALSGGAVSGADRVIATLKARFRACYQKGLNEDPTMSGKVTIAARIGPNGEVTSADVASSSGLSAGVTSCIASAVKRAQFDPQGGTTTLSVPVSFVHQ